jgi:hypothetical protein
MPNIENLKPFTSEQSREEAVKNGQKGGIASGKARREQKIFKQAIAERMGFDDFNEMVDNLIKRAKGNDKSFEVLRDTLGQTVTNTIQVVETPIINDDI